MKDDNDSESDDSDVLSKSINHSVSLMVEGTRIFLHETEVIVSDRVQVRGGSI